MAVRCFLPSLLGFQLLLGSIPAHAQAKDGRESGPSFQKMLEGFAGRAPDSCSPLESDNPNGSTRETEVFEKAASLVVDGLNRPTAASTPRQRAEATLGSLERDGAAIDAQWPEESRLHFSILDLSPILVVKLTFREHASVAVFGLEPKGKDGKWQQIGWDAIADEHPSPSSSVDLYPLRRGPAGEARFLAVYGYSGCAGSSGQLYEARQWRGKDGILDRILHLTGAAGAAPPPNMFVPIGTLRTKSARVTLPYCWFSPFDTGDNPNLCAVDTYDLSGDEIAFRSRVYNRPDIAVVDKAVEYAGKRDYQAVRGYCVSDAVASRLVRQPPSLLGDGRLPVVRKTGPKTERILVRASSTVSFDLVLRSGEWSIAGFRVFGKAGVTLP